MITVTVCLRLIRASVDPEFESPGSIPNFGMADPLLAWETDVTATYDTVSLLEDEEPVDIFIRERLSKGQTVSGGLYSSFDVADHLGDRGQSSEILVRHV